MQKWITSGKEREHQTALKRGLVILGRGFYAEICWGCDGTGKRRGEHCPGCGQGRDYGTALGLLQGGKPAPESVVNQVLVVGTPNNPMTPYVGKEN